MDNKILIGIPTSGLMDYRFALSLATLIVPDGSTLMAIPRVMIDTVRNTFAQKIIETKEYTHLLMIDDDMTFEPDMLLKMLDRDVDIIGALAFKRRPNFEPCVYLQNEKDKNFYPTFPQTFKEVDVIGTGGILIKRNVIETLKFPWFETTYSEDGSHYSVDFDFSIKAKKAGFKIWVDPNIEIGHVGDAPVITRQDFLNTIKK